MYFGKVHKNTHSRIGKTKNMHSLKGSTLMSVGLSRQPPLTRIFIFIDEFLRKCWIFFLGNKDETFSKFVEFKALLEKETGKKVKALKSDNEGEYVSNEFKKICAKEGT